MEIESTITKVLGGDVDTYEAIVRTYQQEVWKTVAAMLLNAPKMEDLVQQTFISAYQHLHRYKRGGDFGVWLKEIARNEVRQEIRRRTREDRRLEVYHTYLLQAYDAPSTQEQQFEEALHECTQKLPPSSAKLVELRYRSAPRSKRSLARTTRQILRTTIGLGQEFPVRRNCERTMKTRLEMTLLLVLMTRVTELLAQKGSTSGPGDQLPAQPLLSAPRLGISRSGANMRFTASIVESDKQVLLQWSTNLIDWLEIRSIRPTGSTYSWTETRQGAVGFYRLIRNSDPPHLVAAAIYQAMTSSDVQGLSVAVMTNGSIAWATGFGRLAKGRPELVDTKLKKPKRNAK